MTTRPDDNHEQLADALNRAFDYRGDVTIITVEGDRVEGYIFDRRQDVAEPYVRIIPSDRDEKITIPYARIASLQFTGRDTAAGKSWETWVRKYAEKKKRGEKASIESEPLE